MAAITHRVASPAGSRLQMFVVPLLVLAISRSATAPGLVVNGRDDGPSVAPRPRRHDVAHDRHDDPQEVNSDA
jgi:hypothetical protein